MKKTMIAASAILALSGCASMNQAECTSADWRMIGFEDGTAGRTQGRIGEYRKACAKHGVSPNLALYQEGYGEGVRGFCTESNGFNQGRSGSSYRGLCPQDLETDFLAAYGLGREHYLLSSEVSSLNARINNGNSRIRYLEKSIARKSLKVASDESTVEERIQLLLEIKNHSTEIGELKVSIPDYEAELTTKEAQYATLERPIYY
jgi:hypothetical protein